MTPTLNTIWVYLAGSPLLWLTATLPAYRVAGIIYTKSGNSPQANPVAVSVPILVLVLYVSNTPYATYFTVRNSFICCLARRRWRWRFRCISSSAS